MKNSIVLATWRHPWRPAPAWAIAYLTVRRRFFGRQLMEIPLCCVRDPRHGAGYLLHRDIQYAAARTHGHRRILIAVFTFRNVPVADRIRVRHALLQIDPSIEEASTILGGAAAIRFGASRCH
jgi:ABC-type Fe3+ transport system permease subunit